MDAPSLIQLFFIFFYIGLFTIGGGLVAITMMQEQLVDKGFISPEEFINMISVSESTPGPIGVNMATYIGNKFYGFPGGVVTTIGEVLPSFICILIIAKFFLKFLEKPVVQGIFSTLKPAATGLVLVAFVQIFQVAVLTIRLNNPVVTSFFEIFKWKELCFYCASLVLLFKVKLDPIILIIAGACFGMLIL